MEIEIRAKSVPEPQAKSIWKSIVSTLKCLLNHPQLTFHRSSPDMTNPNSTTATTARIDKDEKQQARNHNQFFAQSETSDT